MKMYSVKHDAYYLKKVDKWCEEVCHSLDHCKYCENRPEKPSEAEGQHIKATEMHLLKE